MIVRGVKIIEGANDFTDTYDNLNDDLEEFDGLDDIGDDLIVDEDFEFIDNDSLAENLIGDNEDDCNDDIEND